MQSVLSAQVISVIMPIRNEAGWIKRSLGSVLAQDYPDDRIEILIVDGMSDDATRDIVAQVADRHPSHSVRVLDNPHHIVSAAMNIGIAAASGTWIARVDGHCELPPDYLRRCLALARETGAENVGGTQYCVGEGRVVQAIALAGRSRFGGAAAAYRSAKRAGYVDTVFLGFWPKAVLEQVSGFAEELVRHQDYELNLRIRQSGGRIYFDPDLVVRYYSRASLAGLARQYYQYGWWKARVTVQNPGAFRLRHAAAPLFVGATVGLAWLVPWTLSARVALAALVSIYAIAGLGASIAIGVKEGMRYLPSLLTAFALMHLGWGVGFWLGLLSVLMRSLPKTRSLMADTTPHEIGK
jgi:glycosyltransferase involved in cell wall biosynthesis